MDITDARTACAQGLRQRLHGQCLGQAGHALHQQVASGQQGHDHAFEQVVLTHDDLLHLIEHLLHRLAAEVRRQIHGTSAGDSL
jgi:hypothetical protein